MKSRDQHAISQNVEFLFHTANLSEEREHNHCELSSWPWWSYYRAWRLQLQLLIKTSLPHNCPSPHKRKTEIRMNSLFHNTENVFSRWEGGGSGRDATCGIPSQLEFIVISVRSIYCPIHLIRKIRFYCSICFLQLSCEEDNVRYPSVLQEVPILITSSAKIKLSHSQFRISFYHAEKTGKL